jgi:hypothetical protein
MQTRAGATGQDDPLHCRESSHAKPSDPQAVLHR